MSYQAITDIITAQKTSELQLSATVKDSPNQVSTSFADFLASYNSKEVSSDDNKSTEPVKKEDVAAKDIKNEESASEVKVEKGEKSDVAEKADDSYSVEEKTEDKKLSAKDLERKNQKNSKVELKKELSDSEKTGKSEKSAKKEVKDVKKLTKKDFSRLDELTKKEFEAAEITENAETIVAAGQNQGETKLKNELKTDKDSENQTSDLLVNADATTELSENQKVAGDNKANDFEFDFSNKDNKDKKELALDKDGKIKVEDLRTEVAEDISDKKSALKTSEIKLTGENTAVMAVELNPNAEADVLSLNNQTAAGNGSNFQAMLTNQLHNVAPEFVKAGNLILKDNNQGTINLVLHPDDLGNVKIHLSLDGKTLSGHITVATKEALQVFKDNAETLREAFIKNGFDAANFDVAFNNSSQFNQNMDFNGQNDGTNLLGKHVYKNMGGSLDSELEDIFQNAEDISNYSVNIVA